MLSLEQIMMGCAADKIYYIAQAEIAVISV